MPQKTLAVLLIALTLVFTAGCDPTGPVPGRHLYLFIDRSASITPAQRAHWRTAAATAFSTLRRGDWVSVMPIHANTHSAAAVFSGKSRVVDDGAPHEEVLEANEEFDAMVTAARAAVEKLLAEPEPSPETDIFSFIDRLDFTSSAPKPAVILISDMLHSSRRDFDMERTPLTREGFQPLFQRVAKQHNWAPGALAGVSVKCLLPTLDGLQARRDVNDRTILREFWTAVTKALNGSLDRFDTQL